MIPAAKPRETREQVYARMNLAGLLVDRARHPVVVVGVRGYYRDSMGVAGKNDRGIFDDAIFVDTPNVWAGFNANTDASRYRARTKDRQGMAMLAEGVYYAHHIGRHKLIYPALIQRAGVVKVIRDGDPVPDIGYFGINIHSATLKSTSSEGCQTLPASQWKAFISLVVSELKRYDPAVWDKKVVPYVLLSESTVTQSRGAT